MSKKYVVYKHTCPNGKSYIGITSNYESRCYSHQHSSGCNAFYDAIMFFGWDNIKHEILMSNLDKETAMAQEELLIIKHNSLHPNGYNLKLKGIKAPAYKLKTIKPARNKEAQKVKKDICCNFFIAQVDRALVQQAAEKIDVSESELIRRSVITAAKKILSADLDCQGFTGGSHE